MSIRQWPLDDRPRKKLLAKGPKALTDAELLAIFLRVGRKGVNAKQMAQELIDYFGGLGPLLKADQKVFCAAKGLGQAKFCQLQATLELTRRYLDEQLRTEDILTSPEKVMDYLAIQMRDNHREVFAVMLLDTRHRLIELLELFFGTISSASVHPREVAKAALEKNASSVIVAHNHPSGSAEPSRADILITKRLKSALEIIDVKLLDHFVIGKGEIVSLAGMGKL
jgi:DNA repair protein RadC